MFGDDTISLVARLRLRTMATKADALAVATAAAANVATATALIDIMETQLDNISPRLQVLIAVAREGDGGVSFDGGPVVPVLTFAASQRRWIDPSGLEILNGDARLPQLWTWHKC